MFTFIAELFRRLTGPAERRALRRATRWGAAAFAIDVAFCTACGGGLLIGIVHGAILGWFGFVAGLACGLIDRRVG